MKELKSRFECVVAKERARQLGVTDAEYARLLAAQGGHCALCPNEPKTRRLHVDHDHRTGRVRGLLCFRCNRYLPSWVTSEWALRVAAYVGDIPCGQLDNRGRGCAMTFRPTCPRCGNVCEPEATICMCGSRTGITPRARVTRPFDADAARAASLVPVMPADSRFVVTEVEGFLTREGDRPAHSRRPSGLSCHVLDRAMKLNAGAS